MALCRFDVQELPDSVQKTFYSEYLGKQVLVRYNESSARPVPLPEFYVDHLECIKDFEVRDDDIWIVTYPKTGTTFASEMIWMLVADMDYDQSAKVKLVSRLTHIEFPVSRKNNIKQFISIDLKEKPGPRVIRTHLPLSLLPAGLMASKAKIIYVARDPKDTAISFYHHMTEMNRCKVTLDEFLEGFLAGDAVLYGSMFEHVSEFKRESEKRDRMIIVTFEDMKEKMSNVLKKLCLFLDKEYTEEQLAQLEDHLQFNKMKENPSVNLMDVTKLTEERFNVTVFGRFMRKGRVGSYAEEMPKQFIDRFEARIGRWDCKELFNY